MNYKDLLIIGKSETALSIKSKKDLCKYKTTIFNSQLAEIRKNKSNIVDRIISFRESVYEIDNKYHNFLEEILKIYYLGYDYSVIIAVGSITEELCKALLIRERIIINNKQVSLKEKQELTSSLSQKKLIDFLSMASIVDDKIRGNLHEIRSKRNKCMHDFDKGKKTTGHSKKVLNLFMNFLEKYFSPQK